MSNKRKSIKSHILSYLDRRSSPASSNEIINGVVGSTKRDVPESTIRRRLDELRQEGQVTNLAGGQGHRGQYII